MFHPVRATINGIEIEGLRDVQFSRMIPAPRPPLGTYQASGSFTFTAPTSFVAALLGVPAHRPRRPQWRIKQRRQGQKRRAR